ncbi:Patatin-like phospholipase domain-containing protein 1, partial [Irineochytrium annulatum]
MDRSSWFSPSSSPDVVLDAANAQHDKDAATSQRASLVSRAFEIARNPSHAAYGVAKYLLATTGTPAPASPEQVPAATTRLTEGADDTGSDSSSTMVDEQMVARAGSVDGANKADGDEERRMMDDSATPTSAAHSVAPATPTKAPRTAWEKFLYGKGEDDADACATSALPAPVDEPAGTPSTDATLDVVDATPASPSHSSSSGANKQERGFWTRVLYGRGDGDDEDAHAVPSMTAAIINDSSAAGSAYVPAARHDTVSVTTSPVSSPGRSSLSFAHREVYEGPVIEEVHGDAELLATDEAAVRPERGFWVKVLFGKGDDEGEEEEQAHGDRQHVDGGQARDETIEGRSSTTTLTDDGAAQLERIAEAVKVFHPAAESEARHADEPVTSSAVGPRRSLVALPSMKEIGRVVSALPGVAVVSKLPGASLVANLPIVSQVLDAAFPAGEHASAAVKPRDVDMAPVTASAPAPAPALLAIAASTQDTFDAPPPGSVVARRLAGASPSPISPTTLASRVIAAAAPVTSNAHVASAAAWSLRTSLDAAATAVGAVNYVADTAATITSGTRNARKHSLLFRTRDAAIGVIGNVATRVGKVGVVGKAVKAAQGYVPEGVGAIVAHAAGVPTFHSQQLTATEKPRMCRARSLRSFYPRGTQPLSFSFAGGSGVGSVALAEARYAVGVAEGLRARFRDCVVDEARYLGCGLGAVVAAAMALGIDLERVKDLLNGLEEKASNRFMGGVGSVSTTLRASLQSILPFDVAPARGRLWISVTTMPSFNNELLADFATREDLVDALVASCYVPVLHEPTGPKSGRVLLSGALTNPQPLYDGATITVTSRAAAGNVSPFNEVTSCALRDKGFAVVPIRGAGITEARETVVIRDGFGVEEGRRDL